MNPTEQPYVINQALALLNQEPVADLSDASLQQSSAATKLLRHVERARDVILRQHGWTCALSYVHLLPATIAGYVAPRRFPYVYKLPAEFLRVWSIGDHSFCDWTGWGEWPDAFRRRWEVGTIDTNIGGQQILRSTDSAGIELGFVRRAAWGAIDPHVLDVIGYEVAIRGAYAVTGSERIGPALEQKKTLALALALSIDGVQASPEEALEYSHVRMMRLSCG